MASRLKSKLGELTSPHSQHPPHAASIHRRDLQPHGHRYFVDGFSGNIVFCSVDLAAIHSRETALQVGLQQSEKSVVVDVLRGREGGLHTIDGGGS